jgi:hypothetical protein
MSMEGLQTGQTEKLDFAKKNDSLLDDENNNTGPQSRTSQVILPNASSVEALKEYQKERDEYDRQLKSIIDHEVESQHIENWMNVPTEVHFVQVEDEKLFQAKIKIENRSAKWDLSYFFFFSSKVLRADNRIGSIPAKGRTEVLITCQLDKDQTFSDIISSGIMVAGIPIYYKSQLHPKKLKFYWMMFGKSKNFSEDAAEFHQISAIYPTKTTYYGDACFIAQANLGNFVKKQPNLDIKELVQSSHDDLDEDDLLESLWPTDSRHTIIILREQVREWKRAYSILRSNYDGIISSLKVVGLGCAITAANYAFCVFYLIAETYAVPELPAWHDWITGSSSGNESLGRTKMDDHIQQ